MGQNLQYLNFSHFFIFIFILFILCMPVIVASPVTIYGTVEYENGEKVNDAVVIVSADGYPNETKTTVNGAWQVDVGAETGTRWEEGTSFTVTVIKNSYEGTKTGVLQGTYTNVGTVIVKDSSIFQPVSDASKNNQNSSDNSRPVAIISESLYEATVNETIVFSAVDSYDTNGNITGYRWDFNGDGVFDTDWIKNNSITHEYSTPGIYSVIVQVKDAFNTIDSDSAIVDISRDNQGVDIKAKKTGLTSQNIVFQIELNSNIILKNITWSLGDNTTAYGNKINHTYISPGVYFVTVQVKDNNESIFYDIHRIEIKLDTDKDLLSNDLEEMIGSAIWTKNNFITVQIGSEYNLLINTDADRFYDVFYNTSQNNYSVVSMKNMSYLIDNDLDGMVEFMYNETTGSLSVYEDDLGSGNNNNGNQGSSTNDSPNTSFPLFLLSIFSLFLYIYIKKSY